MGLPQGRVTIQSSQLRRVAVSAESGCMRSSFLSWRSTSSSTGFGILALCGLLLELRDLLAELVALAQLASGWPSAAGAGRTRAGERSISPLAWDEISCCMVRTSSSLAMSSWTRRRRSMGSRASRISCAPSTFRSRFEAVRSARRPGSSMLVAMTMTSGEIGLPRFADFSRAALTLRIRASSSRVCSRPDLGLGHGLDARLQVGQALLEGRDARAADALHQHADAAVGQLQHAHDEGDRAHGDRCRRARGPPPPASSGRRAGSCGSRPGPGRPP